jgi:hypothetical protein
MKEGLTLLFDATNPSALDFKEQKVGLVSKKISSKVS